MGAYHSRHFGDHGFCHMVLFFQYSGKGFRRFPALAMKNERNAIFHIIRKFPILVSKCSDGLFSASDFAVAFQLSVLIYAKDRLHAQCFANQRHCRTEPSAALQVYQIVNCDPVADTQLLLLRKIRRFFNRGTGLLFF